MTHRLFVYPTDTVWGIGGSILMKDNHKRIAEIKKTSHDKPLSILFYSINNLREYFNIPELLEDNWLNDFFSLGTSLGLSIALSKKALPEWVHCGSSIVFVRILPFSFVKKMIEEVGAPIFTTSLNITGNLPCISELEAMDFFKTYANDCEFIKSKELIPSGESSTMAIFNEKLNQFSISRRGARVESVEAILKEIKH